MEQRLIDANALTNKYGDWYTEEGTEEGFIGCLKQLIDEQPTVEAEPVRHAKWIFVNCATGWRCQCSECLHWVDAGTDRNYCPNCGARMDEE